MQSIHEENAIDNVRTESRRRFLFGHKTKSDWLNNRKVLKIFSRTTRWNEIKFDLNSPCVGPFKKCVCWLSIIQDDCHGWLCNFRFSM